MKVDVKNASVVGEFKPITPGNYDLMITKAEEKEAKSSGNLYISVEASIMNDDGEEFGKKVWININPNQFGQDIVKSLLIFNNSPLAKKDEIDIKPDDLVGFKFAAKIINKTDNNGNPRSEARNLKAVSEEFSEATLDMFKKGNTAATQGSGFEAPVDSPF